MLFMFKGRARLAARAAVGAVLLLAGILDTSRLLVVVGVVILGWALLSGMTSLRGRPSRDHRR